MTAWARRPLLRVPAALALACALAGCEGDSLLPPLHGTDWSHNVQDSFETKARTDVAFFPETTSGLYVPPKNGEPDSPVAYHAPPSPSYADRPLDENIAGSTELADYLSALRDADLVPWISGPGPYTVFAIPNHAFESLAARLHWDPKAAVPRGPMRTVLGYTIAYGAWNEAALRKSITRHHGAPVRLRTLYGDRLNVRLDPGGALVLANASGDVAHLWGRSYPQSNGVLYLTREALLPASR